MKETGNNKKIGNMKNRTKTLKLHDWTREDFILTYFFVRWGYSYGFYLKDEKHLADYIGVSVNSLKMQSDNFRFLMGKDGLCDVKKLQVEVFEEWSKKSLLEFKNKVKDIINQNEHDLNLLLKQKGLKHLKKI